MTGTDAAAESPPSRPYFSVVIPTYNRAAKLRRALASVEGQTFRGFEVLVCDDGSTDSTGEVVESFRGRMDLRHLREENWGGPARPRNNGLKAARGEWVCFLDSDDWWYPGKLQAVRAISDAADVIYHDMDFVSSRGKKRLRLRSRPLRPPAFVSLLTRDNYLATSGFCVRKTVLDRSGPFSEEKDLVSVEDFDLWVRLSRVTERFVLLPEILGAYWIGEESISRQSEVQIRRKIRVFEKYAGLLGEKDRLETGKLLGYHIGLNQFHLGRYEASRDSFRLAAGSRDPRVKLLSVLFLFRAGWNALARRSGRSQGPPEDRRP